MKHKQNLPVVLSIVLLSGVVFAQPKPDWVPEGASSQYTDIRYMTGFGSAQSENASERIDSAIQRARGDLSGKFFVKIQSEIFIHEKEVNRKDFFEYRNTISAQTQFRLIDVPVQHWDDARHKTAYALAVMERESAVRNYTAQLKEAAGTFASLIKLAEEAEKKGNLKEAVGLYRKTFPVFIEMGETRAIVQILKAKDPFGELEKDDIPPLSASREEIENRIDRLLNEPVSTAQNAAVSLAEQLHGQWKERFPIAVYPFTYRDTDFSSQFSSNFHSLFTAELAKLFTVVSPEQTRPSATVTGNYWVEGDAVRIIPIITDIATGKKLAAASVKLPKSSIEGQGIELKPLNFIQAMEDGKVFLQKEVIPGSLSLEVWTTKGNKNLIFKLDEKMEIIVRVNKPCYLRVLYHLANGPRILLFNNHYIDESKVNRPNTLPKKFMVTPPLGVERLQVFAGEREFPPVRTAAGTFDGQVYDNVFDEDIVKYVAQSRGLKEVIDGIERQVVVDRLVTITTVK